MNKTAIRIKQKEIAERIEGNLEEVMYALKYILETKDLQEVRDDHLEFLSKALKETAIALAHWQNSYANEENILRQKEDLDLAEERLGEIVW